MCPPSRLTFTSPAKKKLQDQNTSANTWPASCKEQVTRQQATRRQRQPRPCTISTSLPTPRRCLGRLVPSARSNISAKRNSWRHLTQPCTVHRSALFQTVYVRSTSQETQETRRAPEPPRPICPNRAEASSSTTGVMGGGAASRTSARGPLNPVLPSRMALQSRLVLPGQLRGRGRGIC